MNDKGAAMTRYEAIEKALQKLIADYESEIHDNYDGTSFLSYRMAEVHDAKDALALPEDSKTVNSGLYNAMRDMADAYAFRVIQDIWPVGAALNASKISASNYLSLREASGEPMPYKVLRDGDKVRFE